MLSSQNPYSPERIDALTKTLSTMDPRARQKYAADHKNDPAVVAVALNVSNILAAAERNKAMQAGTQQQPKVVDQEIAGMAPPPQQMARLPEEQGIAQLPTPNMQNMADGGIAGYDDGGMTGASEFDYAQRSEPVVRMADGGEVKKYAGVTGEQLVRTTDGGKSWFLDIPKTIRDPSVPYYREIPNPAAALADMKFPSKEAALQAATTASTKYAEAPGLETYTTSLGSATPTVNNVYVNKQGDEILRRATDTNAEFNAARKKNSAQAQTSTFQGPNDVIVPRFQPGVSDVPVPAVPSATAPGAAPGAGTGVGTPPGAASERPQPALSAGLPTIKQAQELGDKFFNMKDIKGTLEQNEAQERQDILNEKEARIAKQEAFNKAQGPAMAGYEKLLKSEELQDTTDKEKAGLTALFKGFLGMAAGESPNAAVNIAKGAMVGLDDYSGAMKEFKKSAKERNKAMASIEDARRAEAKGDFKTVEEAETKANDYLRASKRHGIDAIINVTGKSAEISSGIYKEMLQQAGANSRTNAQIAAGKGPGPQEHLFKTLGGGDVAKGLGVYAGVMGPEGKGEQAILAKYAGPQGQIALQMLENSGPEGKLQAQMIRQKLNAALLQPMSTPTGPVRD